jgi:hypothetical protein
MMMDPLRSEFYEVKKCWTTLFCCGDNDRGVENTFNFDFGLLCMIKLGFEIPVDEN